MPVDLASARLAAQAAFAEHDAERLDQACEAILKWRPQDAQVRRLRGRHALRELRLDHAEVHLREAAALDPANPSAWADVARVLVERRREEDAEAVLAAAASRGVRDARSLAFAAALRMALGRFEDARAAVEVALELDPDHGDALRWLAELGGLEPNDALARRAVRKLSAGALNPAQAAAAAFALAEACAKAGDDNGYMEYLTQANAMQANLALGTDRWPKRLRSAQRVAAAARWAGRESAKRLATQPEIIFILAPPGGGGAAAARALTAASHAQSCGMVGALTGPISRALSTPQRPAVLQGQRLSRNARARLIERYLSHISAIAPPHAGMIIDADPANAALAPLAAALFANARFVRVRRNPADAGLSIWRRAFPRPALHTCAQKQIGEALLRTNAALDAFQRRYDGVAEVNYEDIQNAPVKAAKVVAKALEIPALKTARSTPRVLGGLAAWDAERTEARIAPGDGGRYAGSLGALYKALQRS